jgi:ATP-dependent DNA helicase RecG
MAATTDGFELAEKDLEMRGPGEFLGTRQAGFPDLRLAEVSDLDLVEAARQSAQIVFQEDPELARPGNRLLTRRMDRFWAVDADAGVVQEVEEPLEEGEGR